MKDKEETLGQKEDPEKGLLVDKLNNI